MADIDFQPEQQQISFQPADAQPAMQPPQSFAQRLTETMPIQAILGAGDAARQALLHILPQNIRPAYKPVGDVTQLPYKIGRGLGEIGTFAAALPLGGEALAGAKGLPLIGKAAEWLAGAGKLPSLARGIGGTALYGTATSPDRMAGAERGVLAGGIGEALPIAGKAIGAITPQRLTDTIMNTLSKGRGLEENSKSLASDIKQAYKRNQMQAQAQYGNLFKQAGDTDISKEIPGSGIAPIESYKNMPNYDDVVNSYLPNTKILHSNFEENPTVENAHKLQAQLGSDLRKLYSMPRDTATFEKMQHYQNALNNLRNDASITLLAKDPTGALNDQYADATRFYRNKIVPYRSDTKLFKIATGKVTNPQNISSIFARPDANTASIMQDLPKNTNNKILYSEIGKRLNITPSKLTDEVAKLDKKGLSTYITPELENNLEKLGIRTKRAELLQRLTGFGLGAITPRWLGVRDTIPEQMIGGLLGAGLAPRATRVAGALLPRQIGSYPALQKAITGLYLGGR